MYKLDVKCQLHSSDSFEKVFQKIITARPELTDFEHGILNGVRGRELFIFEIFMEFKTFLNPKGKEFAENILFQTLPLFLGNAMTETSHICIG